MMPPFDKFYLNRLIEHMHWANGRTLTSLRHTPIEEGVRLLGHLLTTEHLYYLRIKGQDPWPQDFWPGLSLEQCTALIRQNRAKYEDFLKNQTEEALGREVRYRNSKGEVFHTAISEMLLHLALHGEHHRGQIASLVRAAGGEPAVTDYIVYTREER